jgi:uncharacterized membrane protein YhaH (DUF805 family)
MDCKKEPAEIENFEVIKLLYERASNDWRHYDSHVWQIPSIALAVNTFFIGEAFNKDLITFSNSNYSYRIVRSIIILIASFFTLVLTIALTKHRLHQQGKAKNLCLLEDKLGMHTVIYRFEDPKVLSEIEERPFFLEKWMGKLKTHNWLLIIMALTLILDVIVLIGILAFGW